MPSEFTNAFNSASRKAMADAPRTFSAMWDATTIQPKYVKAILFEKAESL